MTYPVEEVFRTEGVPEFTFVRPPNFNEILVDIRNPGKPVIIEGQSGTGKTTTVRKIIEECLPHGGFEYLSARKAHDIPKILQVADGVVGGKFIIDDFHRLENETQAKIANWAAAGFKDTLLRCMRSEVVHGYKAAIQPGIQD